LISLPPAIRCSTEENPIQKNLSDLVKLFGTLQLSHVFHVHQLALKVIWTDVAQI